MTDAGKIWTLHISIIAIIGVVHFILPDYHHGLLARTMVLALFAMGYNFTFGYTGLLSLGHALFFATGMYAMGLGITQLGLSPGLSVLFALACSFIVSAIIGALALRTAGVSLMIVTLMFAQAGWYIILYFGSITRGDEGFTIPQAERLVAGIDLANSENRYVVALILFAIVLLSTLALVRSSFGKVLVAIRENEERARMLGYNVFTYKLRAIIVSGLISGLAGAAYGLLFGYVGATFASVQYSILPLLWVLLGGAATVLGPFVGTLFMTYLIDKASEITEAHLLVVGLVLVLLTLFARHGIMGEIRKRIAPWLP